MRCIFCKCDSTNETSTEHIIPESFGNTDHVLLQGSVCYKCNQYFSIKVEKPVLDSPIFRHLRSQMQIPSKKGRIPEWSSSLGLSKPSHRIMGRFVAKVGLEVLAFKVRDVVGWNEEIVSLRELDEIRKFARYNQGPDWPFTFRALHPADVVFRDNDKFYELLHEFDILLTEHQETYAVLSLNGVELAINLGGRTLEGYRTWLINNNYASPLYSGKNDFTSKRTGQ